MEQKKEIIENINRYKNGLLTKIELDSRLDKQQIRGSMQPNGKWIGFNYFSQQWLVI